MSVSSVASPPVTVVVPSVDAGNQDDQSKAADAQPAYQPPPPAPLPPGQGTRVDQLA
jgi:hypothetical protein